MMWKQLTAGMGIAMVCSTAEAQPLTWTGAVSTSWNDAANWSTNRVPTAEDDIFIPVGSPRGGPAIGSAIHVRNAHVAGEVDIFGAEVRVRGDLIMDGGTIRIMTFFNLIIWSALIFDSQEPNPHQRITGQGIIQFGSPNHESANLWGGPMTVEPGVVIRSEQGRGSLGGSPLQMLGTVEPVNSTTIHISPQSLANYDPVNYVLTGGTWSARRGRIELGNQSIFLWRLGPGTRIHLYPGGRFQPMEVIFRNEGEVHLHEGRSLTIPALFDPTLTNAGLIALSPGSLLETQRNFSQTEQGELRCEVIGTTIGSLRSIQAADLAGTLRILFAGAAPMGHEVLTVLTAGSVTGEFDTLAVEAALPAGPAHIVYGPTSVSVALCYADCDGTSTLTIFDYLCFTDRFAAGDVYACDCDTGTGPGVCDSFDFVCFGNRFAQGCE